MAEQAGAKIIGKDGKAKNVIFFYMSGGVSHVDSFDPKPKLREMHGKPMPVKVERTRFNNKGKIFGSPFDFKKCGQSGLEISSMFPEIQKWCADDLAVVRSMTSKVNEHAQGNYAFHTGFPFMGHPSAGAWVSYGLGSGNRNLPSFVVLQSGNAVPPHGGVGMYSNGFLPGHHQASIIKADSEEPVCHRRPWLPRHREAHHGLRTSGPPSSISSASTTKNSPTSTPVETSDSPTSTETSGKTSSHRSQSEGGNQVS